MNYTEEKQNKEQIQDIERFIQYLSAERNYSGLTAKAYRSDMYEFAEFIKKSANLQLRACSKNMIRDYLAELYNQNLKKSSIIRKLAVVKSFYKYLSGSGIIETDPAATLAVPKRQKLIPVFITKEEMLKLLDLPGMALRDKAMLELLYSSGLRIEELVSMDLKDIDLISGSVKVFGKGSSERLVPAGDKCLWAIKKYIDEKNAEGVRLDMNSPLFLNRYGKRITQRGARKVLHNWFIKAGLVKKVSPHTIRHTFATHLLDNGCDIRSVQQMLGHKNLVTTQIYTHVTLESLKRVYNSAHPRS